MHCRQRRLLRRRIEFHSCTINKSGHTKKVWKLIVCSSYIWFSMLPQSLSLSVCLSVCLSLSLFLSLSLSKIYRVINNIIPCKTVFLFFTHQSLQSQSGILMITFQSVCFLSLNIISNYLYSESLSAVFHNTNRLGWFNHLVSFPFSFSYCICLCLCLSLSLCLSLPSSFLFFKHFFLSSDLLSLSLSLSLALSLSLTPF